MNDWLNLKDKVIVVTGAVGGMGQKFTADLASHGAKIVLLDLLTDKLNSYAQELQNRYHVETLAITCDSTNEKQVNQAVQKVIDQFGKVDVLINTAAILRFSPLEDLSVAEWKKAIDINLNGYFITSQAFGKQMIKQNKGVMIHISTVAGIFPETYSGAYSTTKAAVMMMSKQIAAEWGQFGIRSNCILPCLVKTPLSEDFYKDPNVEEGRSKLVASKRIGELKDISNAVMFLSSDRSDYINGDDIRVDGGLSIMMQDQIPKPGGRRQYAINHHKK